MRWSSLISMMTRTGIVIVVLGFGSAVLGSGPAEDLFRLVPADSGVTFAVEDLRGHAKQIRESALFAGLSRLEAVRGCLRSKQFQAFERTSTEIKEGLGVSLEVIRDDLLGDAVILVLQPGPADQPDRSEGLLLVKPRDRNLSARLLKSLNEIQTRSGELDRVEPKTRSSLTYFARRFQAGKRPPEFYIQLDDGTFAWSNSERMIQGVIDRKTSAGSGLGDDPKFRKVRQGLPDRVFLSLFVNPRLVERLMADSSAASKTTPSGLSTLLTRYLAAVSQVGFALEWRDGFVIHSHEVLDPEKLEPWLKRWLTRPPAPSQALAKVPSSAVAVVSANLDVASIVEAARSLVPESDRASIANLQLAAKGILMGHDPMTWVVPRLHPDVLLYLDIEPKAATRPLFPWVAVVGWANPAGADDLAGPIDNALRTVLALLAVDRSTQAQDSQARVETRSVDQAKLTTLTRGGRSILADRIDPDQLAISNSVEAISRLSTSPTNPTLAEIRSKYVPDAETFAVVDLERLTLAVKRIQEPMARKLAARSHRPVDATEHDLGQLIELASLFRAFTFSTITSKDATAIHRSIGFIAR